jgi:alpha-glucosidase
METINRLALYYDGSAEFTIPMEPEKNSEVTLIFRTGKNDVDRVFFCENYKEYPMKHAWDDKLFSFYEIQYQLEERKIAFHFKAVKGDEIYYYDMAGSHMQMTGRFEFEITPGFHTPDWAKGAVMYQIFVDRFYNGDKSNDVLTDEYTYINEHVVKVEDWNKYPAAMGVREFYGGDLQGVLDKLDYLEKLGVEVIYFNPLFVSPSNHKYDIQDYDYIDPHIGKLVKDSGELLPKGELDNRKASRYITRVTDKANLEASNAFFAHVVEEIHKRGMKVILDGVFNHCGSFNKWMDRECIYENSSDYEEGAYVSADSPYKDFFMFNEEAWPYNKSYNGWWGHETLPKLHYEGSKKLYDYVMHIGRKWVSPPYNVDGWRLDVAADLGFTDEVNHQFWRDFRKNVKEANPNALILAEHYGDSRSWLNGDQWDTIMNYDAFMEPLSWFLTGLEKHSDERDDGLYGNTGAYNAAMINNMAGKQFITVTTCMNQLSNHDHSRFMTRTNGQVGRTATKGPEAANVDVDKAIFKEAVIIQMTWQGAPTLYYGDEAGVCGWTDPDNRRTYPWGHEDVELIEFYRDAIRIHKENQALKTGSFIGIPNVPNGTLMFGRFLGDNKLMTVVNHKDTSFWMDVPVWTIGVEDGAVMERIMQTERDIYNVGALPFEVVNGVVHVEMPARSAAIFRAKI